MGRRISIGEMRLVVVVTIIIKGELVIYDLVGEIRVPKQDFENWLLMCGESEDDEAVFSSHLNYSTMYFGEDCHLYIEDLNGATWSIVQGAFYIKSAIVSPSIFRQASQTIRNAWYY